MQKIVVAVTGASGAIYARLLLDRLLTLQDQVKELSVVMSENAEKVWLHELGDDSYQRYPFRHYHKYDFNAPFASGSSSYQTMIVCPCSMGTLGRIASGVSDDLISRAADVMLKERRKLVIAVRESPLSLIHLSNMKTVTEAGGIICPASPSFYSRPSSPEKIALTVVDRILDLSGFTLSTFRWGEKH